MEDIAVNIRALRLHHLPGSGTECGPRSQREWGWRPGGSRTVCSQVAGLRPCRRKCTRAQSSPPSGLPAGRAPGTPCAWRSLYPRIPGLSEEPCF